MSFDRKAYMRERARKRKEQGICINCNEPIMEGSKSFCEKHRDQHRRHNSDYQYRRDLKECLEYQPKGKSSEH